MKIAYFLGALNRGGAETLIHDICRQHDKVPYDFVCVYRHEGNMSDAFKMTHAPMIQIPKSGGLLKYILQVRHVLLREKITVVHSQTPSNTLILAVALLGTGIKLITTFHGHTFAPAPWWKRKLVYMASEKIICVSKFEKSFYEQQWNLPKENKMTVVYNGIDFTKFNQMSEEVRDLKNDGKIRLCMVGNFVRGRSQMVVCRAIRLIEESEKWKVQSGDLNFEFYFIGKRDEKETWRYDDCVRYCEEHHLDNIHFLGSRNDVPELLKLMNGFVYSTVHDTFGIAVVEAIAAELPVVVNDWPVMTEVCDLGLLESNHAIHFFKTEDIEDCAIQITQLITEDKRRQKSDCNMASKEVRLKYSLQSHIEQLNRIYRM